MGGKNSTLSDNGPRKERKRIIIIIRRNGAKTR
jgi:hypothetical protein